MAFVAGPRQVGKTTTSRQFATGKSYFSWDDPDHRRLILKGPATIADEAGTAQLRDRKPVIVFDELHKYARWKAFLKGFFDTYGERVQVIVTGSARLEVYRRGGDSLMGRYLSYRMHPLSVGELIRTDLPVREIAEPDRLSDAQFGALWEHGGYPEPFLLRDITFTRRWRDLRRQQLVREDVRDMTRIQEIGQLEVLVELLLERSASHLVYSNLARDVNVSVDTIRRWIAALGALYFGFLVRPWYRNVGKSLRKEPKWYCLDWSSLDDRGQRLETLVACHLLKAVHTWQDLGLGTYELRYLRDKQKREADFVVIRNQKPWFIVEVELSDTSLSPSLEHFQRQISAEHAFQAVLEIDPVKQSCFTRHDPCVVPLRTLLAQLP
jgi:uncharacterized protein